MKSGKETSAALARRLGEAEQREGVDPLFLPQRYDPALPIDAVTYHPANPRQGDIGALHELVDANGFYGAVLIQEQTPEAEPRMRIIAGEHRHRTLVQKGARTFPAFLVSVDDERALQIVLGDNAGADKASYNENTLERVLMGLNAARGHLSGTGYEQSDLQDLVARLRTPAPEALRRKYGAAAGGNPDWPVLKMRLPPDAMELLDTALAEQPGETPADRFTALLRTFLGKMAEPPTVTEQ